jgi:hypothetical protein
VAIDRRPVGATDDAGGDRVLIDVAMRVFAFCAFCDGGARTSFANGVRTVRLDVSDR